MGIAVYRFYIRCAWCSSEITYITDPKNADYCIEQGATRNAEPWREEERESEAAKIKKLFEEEMNPMKALENKTIDSKREIDTAEAIEDLRARKADLERIQSASLLKVRPTANPRTSPEILPDLTAEEEERVKQAFANGKIRPVPLPAVTKPAASLKKLDATALGIRIRPK